MRVSHLSRFYRPLGVAALAGALLAQSAFPASALSSQFAQAIPSIPESASLSRQGLRPQATNLPVGINDVVSGSVDVGTGNLNLNIRAMGYGFSKNSLEAAESGANVRDGWRVNVARAGSLSTMGKNIIWRTGDGYEVPFTPIAGSTTAYQNPSYQRSTLTKTASGWDLKQWDSNTVTSFNNDGAPTGLTDRNGNKTAITTSDGVPTQVTGWTGPAAARTASLSKTGDMNTVQVADMKMTLTASGGKIAEITAVNGSTTTIAYTAEGRVESIQAPATGKVSFTYDSTGRVTSFTRANSRGDQTTRLDYTNGSQTFVAGAETDQSQSVATVPHTTYTLNPGDLVIAARDADGRAVSRTFTANLQTATATTGEGSDAATTTNTFNANNGYSQTGSTSATGAGSQAGYQNTSEASKYAPSWAQDSAGNKTSYSYSAAGNVESSTNALAAVAKLTYNADGTVATATAPGQAGNATTYTYNADHQLIKVTPNTGGSLKAETYTYDSKGRLATRVNGRGQTITYTYDTASRLAKVSYSDGTTPVTYEYNERNQIVKRTDASGTSSMTYDEQGRLRTRENSLANSKIEYFYDKEGRMSKKSNDDKLYSIYEYTAGGKLNKLIYNAGVGQKMIQFKYNARGQRTDTIYGSWNTNGQWTAWNQTYYDASGRAVRVVIKRDNTNPVTVVDRSYCFMANTSPTSGCTASAANDRSKIQWSKDNTTGIYNTYAYDKAGHLIQAKTVGGTNTNYVYTYDARGNRLSGTQYQKPTINSTFNAQNQLTNPSWAYDADGNTISEALNTSTYNAANQMTSVYQKSQGKSFQYTYAGTNQTEMVRQTSPTGTYTYSYGRTDQHGLPIVEKVVKDGQEAYLEQDPTTGRPLFLRTSDMTVNEYATDATFGEMYLLADTDEEQQAKTYDPFGVRVANSNTDTRIDLENPYAYRFGLFDKTTGRYRFGARQYNPYYGVWAERDSLDSPLDHTNANRYAYAGQDPINNYDPTGQFNMGGFLGAEAVGMAFGAAVTAALTAGLPALAGAPAVGIGGCAGGVMTEAISQGMESNEIDWDKIGTSCLTGAAMGGLGSKGNAVGLIIDYLMAHQDELT
jgi:RHS repeat-associated protein